MGSFLSKWINSTNLNKQSIILIFESSYPNVWASINYEKWLCGELCIFEIFTPHIILQTEIFWNVDYINFLVFFCSFVILMSYFLTFTDINIRLKKNYWAVGRHFFSHRIIRDNCRVNFKFSVYFVWTDYEKDPCGYLAASMLVCLSCRCSIYLNMSLWLLHIF